MQVILDPIVPLTSDCLTSAANPPVIRDISSLMVVRWGLESNTVAENIWRVSNVGQPLKFTILPGLAQSSWSSQKEEEDPDLYPQYTIIIL